jgi:hypothetical protein
MRAEQFSWSAEKGWEPPLASARLAGSVQAAFLFGSARLVNDSGCMDAVRRIYPSAHLFGCSTGGVIQNTSVSDETIALTAVAFESTRVATAHARIESLQQSCEAGERLAQQLHPEGLRQVFVLCEGLRVNGCEFLRGMNAALPPGVIASGGCAADGDRLQATHVWCDGPPEESAAVALGFYGDRLRMGAYAVGGWKPFGPDRLITRSKSNVLYEVDNRPALALYKQYLGEYAEGLPANGLLFPLEVSVGGGQRLLRSLLAVDEAEQSITFAGEVPEGAYARFMVGHWEDLIEGTRAAATASVAALEGLPAQLSLVVSCNGRRFVLKQRVEEEIEAVREAVGEQTPITGFYSYGEIAPANGSGHMELHNETIAVTSLAET